VAKSSGPAKKTAKAPPPSRKAPAAKPAPHKKPAPKAPAPKPQPKPAPKPETKASAKAPPPKPAAKPAAKPESKPTSKAPVGKESKAPAAAPKGDKAGAAAPAVGADKNARKGITIVSNKPAKKPASKPSSIKIPEYGTPLSQAIRKPLIASGPGAPRPKSLADSASDKPRKTPFNAKELAYYRQLLLKKRAELVGDVATMETEALMSQSGSLSNLPQHMAEQGSDAYGQSLSLDLAAADRKLIKEIDDALQRIGNGTYGVCELTGKPIRKERLEELPWARYSIEAARELERRTSTP
jgi:DnaK suppressor protein